MNRLDHKDFVLKHDPKGMYSLALDFPKQCEQAVNIAKNAILFEKPIEPDLIMLSGLGGSAIGGDIVRAIFESTSDFPFLVNRDYSLPCSVGTSTLVFISSYSGNTEETLSAYEEAKSQGAKIIVVTSGGSLAELAKKDGHPLILIPSGQPPRTALGYMTLPVLIAAERLMLIPKQDYAAMIKLLTLCAQEWGIEADYEKNLPKQLANALHGNLSVIYGLGSWQGVVANRWKGQINENAKNMTFANVFPELNHNEILGWGKANKQGVANWITIILEDCTESPKMKARAKVTAELIRNISEIYRVQAKGKTLLEKIFSLIYFGDFVSLYLAALNEVDPETIDSINYLKSMLAKVT